MLFVKINHVAILVLQHNRDLCLYFLLCFLRFQLDWSFRLLLLLLLFRLLYWLLFLEFLEGYAFPICLLSHLFVVDVLLADPGSVKVVDVKHAQILVSVCFGLHVRIRLRFGLCHQNFHFDLLLSLFNACFCEECLMTGNYIQFLNLGGQPLLASTDCLTNELDR